MEDEKSCILSRSESCHGYRCNDICLEGMKKQKLCCLREESVEAKIATCRGAMDNWMRWIT